MSTRPSVDEFLALNDLRDCEHFLACTRPAKFTLPTVSKNIDYQLWLVVADERAQRRSTFSNSWDLALHGANAEGVVV